MHPSNYLTAGAKAAYDIFSEFESRFSNILDKRDRLLAALAVKILRRISSKIEAARENGSLVCSVDGARVVARINA